MRDVSDICSLPGAIACICEMAIQMAERNERVCRKFRFECRYDEIPSAETNFKSNAM